MKTFTSVLSWLCDGYWPTAEGKEDSVEWIADMQSPYRPLRLLASGDAANLYLATRADEPQTDTDNFYILKVAISSDGNALLDIERKTLATLLVGAGNTTYGKYLPALVESYSTNEPIPRRINAFRWEPGFHTLEQVHEQHPALDGRHLAWIFKRLLTVLGFCHRQSIVHGAVLPCHALIHAGGHGLRLVGWGQSVARGRRIRTVPARYQDWYPVEVRHQRPAGPATDLFLAARCLVYLAGGDPLANRMPDSVPPTMRRFLQTCLLESSSMRPRDAWELIEDFDELLYALYGPPAFHELTLT
jgi:hypothetical protein